MKLVEELNQLILPIQELKSPVIVIVKYGKFKPIKLSMDAYANKLKDVFSLIEKDLWKDVERELSKIGLEKVSPLWFTKGVSLDNELENSSNLEKKLIAFKVKDYYFNFKLPFVGIIGKKGKFPNSVVEFKLSLYLEVVDSEEESLLLAGEE